MNLETKNRTGFAAGKSIIMASLAASVAAIGLFMSGCAKVPQDGVNAKEMRFDGLRNVRYAEVFLIGGNGITKNLQAAFYNTSGLNNETDKMNTCPQALWDGVDPEVVKKEYKVLSVFKNGPRHWVNDWITIPVGKELDFNGLKARWFGQVKLPKVDLNKAGSTAYKPTTVARSSKMGFKAGEKIFVLEDPQGRPWVMQAFGLKVDANLTYEDLMTLDKKLKPAEGWSYKVKVLEKELVISAVDGIAHIVQDELGGTYDLCADGSSNYIP